MAIDELKQHIDGATEMLEAWEKEYDISLSPSINFTGGEPFLYKGLWDVITHARKSGLQGRYLDQRLSYHRRRRPEGVGTGHMPISR